MLWNFNMSEALGATGTLGSRCSIIYSRWFNSFIHHCHIISMCSGQAQTWRVSCFQKVMKLGCEISVTLLWKAVKHGVTPYPISVVTIADEIEISVGVLFFLFDNELVAWCHLWPGYEVIPGYQALPQTSVQVSSDPGAKAGAPWIFCFK